MPVSETTKWITSKDVLQRAGISRATLNNYIKMGIIPRPVVRKPESGSKATKKIGYFSEKIIETIERVKILKRKGVPMEEMTKRLRGHGSVNHFVFQNRQAETMPLEPLDAQPGVLNTESVISAESVKLTIDDLGYAAYMMNPNFEIEWINREAEDEIFKKDVRSIASLESRNIFKLIFHWEFHEHIENWQDLIAYHMSLAKPGVSKKDLEHLYEGIPDSEVRILESLYDDQPSLSEKGISKTAFQLNRKDGQEIDYEIYTVTFREGTLFVYVPADRQVSGIVGFLQGREDVIHNLLKRRMPSLVSLCILVADLQDSVKISAELPPAEYFELINGMWKALSKSFARYNGIHGKHAGDGMLYYFIKKPKGNYIRDAIFCALELRERVKQVSDEWKARKGWLNELYLNIGINEGKEFFGAIRSNRAFEFTALGDSINYAGRLSDLARYGGIMVTKNTINRLGHESLESIRYGIRRKSQGRDIFIENTFSRVLDLLDPNSQQQCKYQDISTLPVAEIVGRTDRERMIDGFNPPDFGPTYY